MKTSLILGAAAAILGLLSGSLVGQTNAGASSGYIETSKIVGTKVKTAQGEEVGSVKDVVIDRSTGCMAYTVISAGGTSTEVSGQSKLVAVPWTVYTTATEPDVLVVNVDRDRIYNAPAFDYGRINEYSTGGYIDNVYSYYGVSRQAGVGEQTSVRGSAATEARQGEGATASPEDAARSKATASASPAATRSSRGTAGRGREESPAGSPRETEKPTSRRRHTEKMTSPTREEETSETNTSPSKQESRHRGAEERSEPAATATPED